MAKKTTIAVRLRKAGVTKIYGVMPLSDANGNYLLYFCKVRLECVRFDDDYQRDEFPKHVANIINNFDVRAARPLAISFRDGDLNCYDGRQTWSVLTSEQIDHVEHCATVFVDMNLDDERTLFFYLNDIPKKMSGWKKFAAAYRSPKFPIYRKWIAAADKHNLTTPIHPNVDKAKYADITCCSIFKYAYNKGGMTLVNLLCLILNRAWRDTADGPVQEAAKKVDILRGLVDFLKDNKDLPNTTLIQVLKAYRADGIQAEANKQLSKGRIDATQVKNALCKVFGKTALRRAA